jgi:hypothetical protein
MAIAEREPIWGVGGGAPSGIQGQSSAPGQGSKIFIPCCSHWDFEFMCW